jgi:tetratricopeptide (TPR) repeat protein
MAKKSFFVGILGMVMVFGLVLISCGTLSSLINPAYALDENGEKVKAVYSSNGRTVKVDGIDYSYTDRPAVPAAPKKPTEPQKPTAPSVPVRPSGNAPQKPVEPRQPVQPSFDTWFSRNYPNVNNAQAKLAKQSEFYNSSEYRDYEAASRSYKETYPAYQSALQTYNNYQNALSKYEQDTANYQTNLNRYNAALEAYQDNLVKYKQDTTRYEQELAVYQAALPEYTATVEAQSKTIQDSINPNVPNNWDRYVDGKYLLYRGK